MLKVLLHCNHAGMAELAVAPDLGSGVHDVQVRPLLPAPNQYIPNSIFLIGDGFGLFIFSPVMELPVSGMHLRLIRRNPANASNRRRSAWESAKKLPLYI